MPLRAGERGSQSSGQDSHRLLRGTGTLGEEGASVCQRCPQGQRRRHGRGCPTAPCFISSLQHPARAAPSAESKQVHLRGAQGTVVDARGPAPGRGQLTSVNGVHVQEAPGPEPAAFLVTPLSSQQEAAPSNAQGGTKTPPSCLHWDISKGPGQLPGPGNWLRPLLPRRRGPASPSAPSSLLPLGVSPEPSRTSISGSPSQEKNLPTANSDSATY